ncbi:hypothetical protein [Actinokineospora enzanensis]|uniref:hypothetical protein n=1 Tax=Actinokineospora enzanensis TaxID=155975 RepID=UPI00036B7E73|nr:hypothetical protein [Actinokineospora enzanensis]
MDTREGTDWAGLEHAYGGAEDTPALLDRLREDDWSDAVGELHASILHQGSVYPATVAAVPILVDIAQDPTAPGRTGALWLLTAYAESIAQGAGRDPQYLPDDTDLTTFDHDTRTALAEATSALLPLMDDPNPETRQAVYGFVANLTDDPGDILRARFEAEVDTQASVALMEPLLRHGQLAPADLDVLIERGNDQVTFAALWSAVATGVEAPADQLVRLWPDHAETYPGNGSSIETLLRHAGARAVPVLRQLRTLTISETARAWTVAAEVSRSAVGSAVEGLLTLAPHTPEENRAVVAALALVLPGAPEHASRICDAVARWGSAASAAAILFAARDPRWAGFATTAVSEPEEPRVAFGTTRMPLSYAMVGFPARRRPAEWATDDLITVATAAITRWRASGWVEAMETLPPNESIALAALPAWKTAPKAVATLVARSSLTPTLRAALRELDPEEPWHTVIEAITTDSDAAFTQAWTTLGPDTDLLDIWRRFPTPGLPAACLDLLDGTAHTSFPARQCQLTAARVIADTRAWPTVRAIVDEAGAPLPDAITVAFEVGSRAELVDLLWDIAREGRRTWSGPDHWAAAVALQALADLAEITPDDLVTRALATFEAAITHHHTTRIAPVVAELLRTALTAEPALRDRIATTLGPLLDDDHRFPTSGNPIEEDTLACQALRAVLEPAT